MKNSHGILDAWLSTVAALSIASVVLVCASCSSGGKHDRTDGDSELGIRSKSSESDSTGEGGVADTASVGSSGRYAVTFRDRTVDLEPFLIGFPYGSHIADLEHGQIFYFERTPEGRWLRHQELDRAGTFEHSAGRQLGTTDWSERSMFGGEYHAPTNRLYLSSDEANDEHINVYSVDLDTGKVSAVTTNDYTYGWSFSEDGRYLGYLARTGETEPFETTLHVRDLETGEDRAVLSDGAGADRFTWSAVRFSPENDAVYVTVQHDGQRNTKSLARIDLELAAPTLRFIHPDRVVRYSLGQVDGWVDEDSFLYTSAETGFSNLYRHDVDTGASEAITDFRDELRSAALLDTEPKAVAVVLGRPHESELRVLDATTGESLYKQIIPATVSLMDADGTDVLVSENSLERPWRGQRLKVRRSGGVCSAQWADFASIPRPLERAISHYEVEKVSFPTFDRDEDGSPRMLHGFLLEPKNPPADPSQRLVRIKSFYGGGNNFDTSSQIMAAAGIATFSPAPRGSSGFGAEFAALNDGDLGGDEIVDIIYAARWLASEKGYEPHQIGVYGGSHGGYATMRALTFPPATNGRDASFPFGFGWSHAGFSNIVSFYESCNIPDWVIKEAGNPETESDKLLDRSPIAHVEKLDSPILLTHGSNDWRVPVTESRTFVEKASALGKPVTYVEFEGQGHGIRGFENMVRYYQAALDFFESLEVSRVGG